jgi:ribosome-associated toxin RatA of RatAB toxin-antitoxin module
VQRHAARPLTARAALHTVAAMPSARLRALVLLALVTASAPPSIGGPATVHAGSDKPAVTTRSLPAERGVRSEAETVLEAPAELVAALLGEPSNFVPLFPAERVEVISASPERMTISVEMKKPFPIGTVRWVEDVVTYRDNDGKDLVVERNAKAGYFRTMRAIWRITPHPDSLSRCLVIYQVSMELQRWVPEWMLRKGNLNGMLDTMSRLRKLVAERHQPETHAAAAHQ